MQSRKREREEEKRGRIEGEREREIMKEERGDAAPLYLNNIIWRDSQKCGDIIWLQAFPRVYDKSMQTAVFWSQIRFVSLH